MGCLRKKPADDLINFQRLLLPAANTDVNRLDFNTQLGYIFHPLFAPVVDGSVIPRDPSSLLSDHEYLRANGVLDRTYLISHNNHEELFVYLFFPEQPPDYRPFTNPFIAEEFVKAVTCQVLPPPISIDAMKLVVDEYTYPRTPNGTTDSMDVISIFGDLLFVIPSVYFARAINHASAGQTPVFMYLFDHYPELLDPTKPFKGSNHMTELNFQFDRNPYLQIITVFYAKLHTETDRPLYNIMRNSTTQFAKTGLPSSQEYESWPMFESQNQSFLAIDEYPDVRQRVFESRVQLWDSLMLEEENPQCNQPVIG